MDGAVDVSIRERPAELLQRLIRFDTSNPPGNEAECIAFIEKLVVAAGAETKIVFAQPGRPNLVARLPGRGEAPPLLLQCHVDVVAAKAAEWEHDPFEAEIADGFIWGRGALDMKSGVAMLLAAFLRAAIDGPQPAGDLIFTALCDEEAGSALGAKYVVEQHPELFEGVRYALGEFGGFSIEAGGRRIYMIEVAEKQVCWMRGVVRGPGGHGSIPLRGSALAKTGEILRALDRERMPIHITPPVAAMIEGIATALPGLQGAALRSLLRPVIGPMMLRTIARRIPWLEPLLRNTASATVVSGGDKVNVIPSEVELQIDGRILPGFTVDQFMTELRKLIGDEIELEVFQHDPGPPEPDMTMFPLLEEVLLEADPTAAIAPLVMPGVSDARFFAQLGIQTYGFLPMQLPPNFNFQSLIHAANERIPTEALDFGTDRITQVLERFK
jgi:acetylornithine deacetylase/succinyl-diaminopimelate desuccinylase-like protein